MKTRFAVAFAALIAGGAAFGADSGYVDIERRLTPEQRHATGLDTLSQEQLELLNRLLRAQEPATPSADATAAAVAPKGSDREIAAVPAGDAQASAEPRDEGKLVGFFDQAIASRLVGSISGWEPGTVFALENGQKWKVLKGAVELPKPLDRPQVEVIPGVAGRWFLQVTESMPKARVYRID